MSSQSVDKETYERLCNVRMRYFGLLSSVTLPHASRSISPIRVACRMFSTFSRSFLSTFARAATAQTNPAKLKIAYVSQL